MVSLISLSTLKLQPKDLWLTIHNQSWLHLILKRYDHETINTLLHCISQADQAKVARHGKIFIGL